MSSRQFEYRESLDALRFTEGQKQALASRASAAVRQSAGTRRARRPLGRMAVIAAVLALVLAVGSSAAGILPEPIDVFAPLFGGAVAQTEVIDRIGHPIGASDTDSGITVTADAIMGDEYNAVIVYSLTREDGARFLPEGVRAEWLMLGGFGGSSWTRAGSHGSAWFVDEDPEDNRIQYVETVSADSPLTRGTADVSFWELSFFNPETEQEETLYEGRWKFRFEVNYEDCSIRLGGGETFSRDGLNFTIDEIRVSPIAVKVDYTVDQEVQWSDAGSGRQDARDELTSRQYMGNVEILLVKTDGTAIDLTSSGGSIRPDSGVTRCSKGQVLEEILPLEEVESVSVGGILFPLREH